MLRCKVYRVNVRVDAPLRKRILQEAKRLSLSVSDVIRMACINQYKEEK